MTPAVQLHCAPLRKRSQWELTAEHAQHTQCSHSGRHPRIQWNPEPARHFTGACVPERLSECDACQHAALCGIIYLPQLSHFYDEKPKSQWRHPINCPAQCDCVCRGFFCLKVLMYGCIYLLFQSKVELIYIYIYIHIVILSVPIFIHTYHVTTLGMSCDLQNVKKVLPLHRCEINLYFKMAKHLIWALKLFVIHFHSACFLFLSSICEISRLMPMHQVRKHQQREKVGTCRLKLACLLKPDLWNWLTFPIEHVAPTPLRPC